ncbi:MAG: hypothetical protein B6I26_04530 [Desulfobacteraceae bacterium 4572_130]|nr:MAG: hypothetical protein B6I26_04530 [Desulfobacteraceae bacterium 4572_130]
MQILSTKKFKKDYKKLLQEIQKATNKQIIQLLENSRISCLNLKKMQGHPNIWEVRITKEYRATLQIENNLYVMRKIGTHDILKNP